MHDQVSSIGRYKNFLNESVTLRSTMNAIAKVTKAECICLLTAIIYKRIWSRLTRRNSTYLLFQELEWESDDDDDEGIRAPRTCFISIFSSKYLLKNEI